MGACRWVVVIGTTVRATGHVSVHIEDSAVWSATDWRTDPKALQLNGECNIDWRDELNSTSNHMDDLIDEEAVG